MVPVREELPPGNVPGRALHAHCRRDGHSDLDTKITFAGGRHLRPDSLQEVCLEVFEEKAGSELQQGSDQAPGV